MSSFTIYNDPKSEVEIKETESNLIFICTSSVNDDYEENFKSVFGEKKLVRSYIHWSFKKSNKKAVGILSHIIDQNIEDLFQFKQFEKKILWTNPDKDKHLIDYSDKSLVFFGETTFTDDYPEFQGDLCLRNNFQASKTQKRSGFCFYKNKVEGIKFLNSIINEDNNDEKFDLMKLLGITEKKEYVKKPPVEIEGVPKPIKTPMDVFHNLTLSMESNKKDIDQNDLFIELISIMEQRVRVLKTKEYPDGSICIYGPIDEVLESFEKLQENTDEDNEDDEWYIKNDFVVGKNKILIVMNDSKIKNDLKIKKISKNKISLFGTIEQVDSAVEKYSDEDNEDVFKIEYSYIIEGLKVCTMIKE